MRPSRTSLLALTASSPPPGLGPGNAAVRRGQAAPPATEATASAARGTMTCRSPWPFARKSSSRPRSARRPSRTFPASVTVVAGQPLEQQRADDFQDLVPLVPGLSLTTTRPGCHPHHLARHQYRRRRVDDRRLLRRRAVRIEHRPGQRRHRRPATSTRSTSRGSRCCAARRAPCTERARSAASSSTFRTGPAPRGSRRSFLGSAETVDNGDPGYSLTGLVNVPLGDKAALRASGFYRFDGGFIDSIGNNPIPSLTNPAVNVIGGTRVEDGLNSLDRFGGRLAALFKPSDKLSVNLAAQMQNIESDASSIVDARPGEPRAAEQRPGAVALPVGVQRHEVPGLQRHDRLGPRGRPASSPSRATAPSSRTSRPTWPSRPT